MQNKKGLHLKKRFIPIKKIKYWENRTVCETSGKTMTINKFYKPFFNLHKSFLHLYLPTFLGQTQPKNKATAAETMVKSQIAPC